MTNPMIERVAIAIREELDIDWPFSGHAMLMTTARAAIAAIAAMREPTEEMIDVGAHEPNEGIGRSETWNVWTAMIDSALGAA